ncbi:MAG: rhodanese-like domain-containing protein [Deltaproteobacteria bacterium]|nr:rhodanese-like domain-containing protein [Deltaproteobacteria bacterium]
MELDKTVEQTSYVPNRRDAGLGDVSLQELYPRLGGGSPIILDVLPREAYISAHIPGAISLPLAEVSSRAPEVIPDREAEIVVYCASAT